VRLRREKKRRRPVEASRPDVQAKRHAFLKTVRRIAVARLPRRPGQKEARFAHLLSWEVHHDTEDPVVPSAPAPSHDRILVLEHGMQELRNEVSDLRAQLEAFRKQFE
jgi:uncharacterized protein YceH (UPF0502 family)